MAGLGIAVCSKRGANLQTKKGFRGRSWRLGPLTGSSAISWTTRCPPLAAAPKFAVCMLCWHWSTGTSIRIGGMSRPIDSKLVRCAVASAARLRKRKAQGTSERASSQFGALFRISVFVPPTGDDAARMFHVRETSVRTLPKSQVRFLDLGQGLPPLVGPKAWGRGRGARGRGLGPGP